MAHTMTADTVLAQSAIDRLTAAAHTLVIEGPSANAIDPTTPTSILNNAPPVVPSQWQSGGPITLASDTTISIPRFGPLGFTGGC